MTDSNKRARLTPQKVIIDTDPGVDDFWALCLALGSPELDIIGITIVWGNTKDLDAMARNACAALTLCGRPDIKVVKGLHRPMLGDSNVASGKAVHGENGLGNVILPDKFASTQPLYHNYQSAAHFLTESCRKYPGEITLITLGPFTNIADAIRTSAKFSTDVKSISMMGGTVHGGQFAEFGNRSPVAEANIASDPEAAKLVFASFPVITMAGLNVTMQLEAGFWAEQVKGINEAGRLLHCVAEHYVAWVKSRGLRVCGVHDPCAVLALTHPHIFTEKKLVCVDVETKGELTRGETVADWKNHWRERKPQTTVLMKIDKERALDAFLERIGGLKFPDLGELKKLPGSL
eukprot:gnl/MRDRNA2_/MRDRNA2_76805_c0_seq1.p1 gnl/MRDRNA2_/MRDRNA2_76805_c0~~gnl/MRDRNA2_/MRDRNA2_76805_c0_seq1.p1  ORF type:complete len:348 (-),score=56.41 gnl/MRDRNA2_/MRDRNA2_76805_c0_seq1:42-1085(-)